MNHEIRVLNLHALAAVATALEETSREGTEPHYGPTAGSAAILKQYREWLGGGSAASCGHSPEIGMGTVTWSPSNPVLSCVPCMGKGVEKIKGTPEDYTCDLCRKQFPDGATLINGSITIPGAIQDGMVVATTVIFYGLCDGCNDGVSRAAG